jgi:LysM repeat protein
MPLACGERVETGFAQKGKGEMRDDPAKSMRVLTKFCKSVAAGYNQGMKPVLQAVSLMAGLCLLNGCRVPGKQSPNVGPFDSRGNYVEAWADDPSKWRPYTPREVDGELPRIAKNEQPPENSIPLATTKASPPRTAAVAGRAAAPDTTREVARGSATARAAAERTVAKKSASKSKPDTERTAASSTKSKASVAKAKPKAKSASTRHTVKSGDSLSSIAAKYGTSVSALKKANGLSGTMIRDGKSLVVPRRK